MSDTSESQENRGDGQQRNESENNRANESTNNHKNPYYDWFIAWVEPYLPPPVAEGSETAKRRKHFEAHQKLVLEIAGFAFLIIGFIVAFGQLAVLMWQLSEMHRQSASFQGQLKEMQKTRMEDERAWIDPYQFTKWSDDGFSNSWYVILRYRNIGKTPATHVFAAFGITNSFDNVPNLKTFAPTNTSEAVLFPNDEAMTYSDKMSVGEYITFLVNNTPGYEYGIIIYDDVHGVHHWVKFCRVFDVRRGLNYPALYGNECDTND